VPPQIFTCGIEWPRLANVHDIGDRVLSQFVSNRNSKIGQKVGAFLANNFGARGNNDDSNNV